ncbi:hypothetical protein COY90_05205 [Candidatus Roizmanbacteria bacterium CG_4_10_14_0_8_um_filter_39_9]|uniref:Cupin type-2 domain-containing protein n=1 Tax=Candidatus Roizmanbacteria bacterium CG_4_10_14_0_8_um_filter_39_9 TaxID=1974829 RepID=A0A2M7QCI1_9BACT|nr:MAG: hypothetical protein COY90_05205 [Candidatus Roizmanbacteria bacterium CG_4_10_14_0_8_um_filter_39_9]
MYKIVRKSEARVRGIAPNKTADNYITKETTPVFSFATTKGDNYYEKIKVGYNRLYFILEGELVLTFNEKEERLKKDDSIYIEKNTEYEINGTFNAVVVNEPAFGTIPKSD